MELSLGIDPDFPVRVVCEYGRGSFFNLLYPVDVVGLWRGRGCTDYGEELGGSRRAVCRGNAATSNSGPVFEQQVSAHKGHGAVRGVEE